MKSIALSILVLLLLSSNVLAKDLLVFGAEWCNPCKNLKVFLKSSSVPFEYKKIEYIDIDQFPVLSKKMNIKYVPTSIIFDDDGSLEAKVSGFNKRDYIEWLEEHKE